MPEPEPDDPGHDDDDQRKDLGGRKEVLHQGGRFDLPAVDECQETLRSKKGIALGKRAI